MINMSVNGSPNRKYVTFNGCAHLERLSTIRFLSVEEVGAEYIATENPMCRLGSSRC
jgi:Fe-S oxidoreductase